MERWVGAFAASVEELLYKGCGGKGLKYRQVYHLCVLTLDCFLQIFTKNPAKGCKWLKYLAVTNIIFLVRRLWDPDTEA